MPRRPILSAAERKGLLALPDTEHALIQHYTLNEQDLALVRQRRGDANRLGFAVQRYLMRFPGIALGPDMTVPAPLIQWIARQARSTPGNAARDGAARLSRLEAVPPVALPPTGPWTGGDGHANGQGRAAGRPCS